MHRIPLIETRQDVTIPNVGPMVRIERSSADGEVVDIEYRLPARPELRVEAPQRLPIGPHTTTVILTPEAGS